MVYTKMAIIYIIVIIVLWRVCFCFRQTFRAYISFRAASTNRGTQQYYKRLYFMRRILRLYCNIINYYKWLATRRRVEIIIIYNKRARARAWPYADNRTMLHGARGYKWCCCMCDGGRSWKSLWHYVICFT